jgi:hypothetical protein
VAPALCVRGCQAHFQVNVPSEAAPDLPDRDFDGAVPDPAVVKDAFATWKAEIAKADEWLDALEEPTSAARCRSTVAPSLRVTCLST